MRRLPPGRRFVVEFPDDDLATLDAVMEVTRLKGGVSFPTLFWLLGFESYAKAIHCKLEFGHLGFAGNERLVVPEEDRDDVRAWLVEQTPPLVTTWTYLEYALPDELKAARDWARAYHEVVGRRPRLRRLLDPRWC
jgi:hypothetical protein